MTLKMVGDNILLLEVYIWLSSFTW